MIANDQHGTNSQMNRPAPCRQAIIIDVLPGCMKRLGGVVVNIAFTQGIEMIKLVGVRH